MKDSLNYENIRSNPSQESPTLRRKEQPPLDSLKEEKTLYQNDQLSCEVEISKNQTKRPKNSLHNKAFIEQISAEFNPKYYESRNKTETETKPQEPITPTYFLTHY